MSLREIENLLTRLYRNHQRALPYIRPMERAVERGDTDGAEGAEDAAAATPDRSAAVDAIVSRMEGRIDEISDRVVERQRAEIPAYGAIPRSTQSDIRTTAIRLVEDVIDALRRDSEIDPDRMELFRSSAERRVQQRVPIDALLQAYRIWQQVFWHEVQAEIRTPAEREAALWIADELMRHVNVASTLVAQAYIDALAGIDANGDLIRRDILEALIGGRVSSAYIEAQVEELLDLRLRHVVVVARWPPPVAGQSVVRDAAACLQRHLRPTGSRVIIGVRDDEVVAIYPARDPSETHDVEAQASAVAQELSSFAIGVGRAHAGTAGIAASHGEAQEAAALALMVGGDRGAITFADVLLDRILRAGRHGQVLLDETIAPLVRYDAARHAALVATLRAYFESTFSLTRSAAKLHVHPNTVMYRLQRIGDLTGRNATRPDDLLLLLMGLKLHDLGGSPTDPPPD
jgi:hypothetical protein